MLVVECIPYQLAEKVSAQLSIPVIEIGSDPKIDGQVIIFHDLDTFGVDCVPKFANVNRKVMLGLIDYVQEVRAGTFPELDKHTFELDPRE